MALVQLLTKILKEVKQHKKEKERAVNFCCERFNAQFSFVQKVAGDFKAYKSVAMARSS
jgi:hypothetical protein